MSKNLLLLAGVVGLFWYLFRQKSFSGAATKAESTSGVGSVFDPTIEPMAEMIYTPYPDKRRGFPNGTFDVAVYGWPGGYK